MRIGILAPITHSTPPKGYGPWERVAGDIADGLVSEGQEVILFAPVGSGTSARLAPTVPHPLSEWPIDEEPPDFRIWEEVHIAEMASIVRNGGFDIVHSHLHVHALGYADFLPCPMVTTLHGVAWNKAVRPALRRYRSHPFVSISDSERAFLPELRYVGTVYNGIQIDDFPYGEGGEALLFAGRLAPEKAPHLAIEAAISAGRSIRLVGGIEPKHQGYFSEKIEPFLSSQDVEYVGPLSRSEIAVEYANAAALVMPLEWDEPFGLVVVEAMAAGTPVVAWARGAMPELVRDGETGFLVSTVDEAVDAIGRIERIDRSSCRKAAASRFSIDSMARGYLEVYRRLVEG